MKFFWPYRPKAKGCSDQNSKSIYNENNSDTCSNKRLNQLLDDRNLKSTNVKSEELELVHFSTNKGHWANRDFSKYWDAA